jgi:dTDP-4-dehydrorhamnose 3,5-epimerase
MTNELNFVYTIPQFFDKRGFFCEIYETSRYREVGINELFVQDNHSRSKKNVLRGMHFSKNFSQAQMLTVITGRIFDVVVDVRRGSPTFGKWFGAELGEDGPTQVFMSQGFAHGFCVLSDFADLHYKVTQKYDPEDEGGLLWNDPDVGISWPVEFPIISERDKKFPTLFSLQMAENYLDFPTSNRQ